MLQEYGIIIFGRGAKRDSISNMKCLYLGAICLILITGCSGSPQSTPTSPKVVSTPIVITPSFLYPRSDFDLTIAIHATKTDLIVGDVITVTVTTTNTGKLPANFTYCDLRGWLDKGKTSPNDYLSEPIVEPGYQQIKLGHIIPGEVQTCTFGLKASHLGTVWLEGAYGGEVIFGAGPGPIESWVGESSPLLEIRAK